MHATGQTMVIRVPISKEVFEYPAAIKLPPGTAASQLTPYSLTSSLPIHDRFDFKTFTAPAYIHLVPNRIYFASANQTSTKQQDKQTYKSPKTEVVHQIAQMQAKSLKLCNRMLLPD